MGTALNPNEARGKGRTHRTTSAPDGVQKAMVEGEGCLHPLASPIPVHRVTIRL